jgi:hypothetical protein
LRAWLDRTLAKAMAPAAEDRFADAIEFAFELEHGAIRAAPAQPQRHSLYDRNPLLFWKLATVILAAALMLALALRI